MENVVEAPDFTRLITEEHANKWIALTPDYSDILAVGDSLADVLAKTGKEKVAVMQVPSRGGYAPIFR